ncbi:MAG: hypothetical protein IJU18_05730 [Oscillospiraceae bacterium]|nr:hypothetical protein [Oscillospiraceae bacterium]
MKRTLCAVLAALLLCGCGGKDRAAEELQERYAAMEKVTLSGQITCHLPGESRTFAVECAVEGDGARVTVTAPEELAGITARIKGEELTLEWDGTALPAGRSGGVDPCTCLPWLLRAAADGYVTEQGRRTLEEIPCLWLALDATAPDGGKVVCQAWFDETALTPVYAEFYEDGALALSVRVTGFTAEETAP